MMEGVQSGGREPRLFEEFCVDNIGVPIATTCSCGVNDCPTVYLSRETGHLVIQGYVVDSPTVPAGEGRVRVPVELIRDAYHALRASAPREASSGS
jgi:hypothetical protein